jgi:hypothetical protein
VALIWPPVDLPRDFLPSVCTIKPGWEASGKTGEACRPVVNLYEEHFGSIKGDRLLDVLGHPRAHENDVRRGDRRSGNHPRGGLGPGSPERLFMVLVSA